MGDSGYSDVTLGLCARKLGIKNNHIDKFNSQNPEFYSKENETIKDMFTFHYVGGERMIEMYSILNNT